MEKSTFTPQYELVRAKLRQMRENAGLSQRALADRVGRERSFVDRIESGDRRVDIVELVWLAQACGADPEQLVIELVRGFERRRRAKV